MSDFDHARTRVVVQADNEFSPMRLEVSCDDGVTWKTLATQQLTLVQNGASKGIHKLTWSMIAMSGDKREDGTNGMLFAPIYSNESS